MIKCTKLIYYFLLNNYFPLIALVFFVCAINESLTESDHQHQIALLCAFLKPINFWIVCFTSPWCYVFPRRLRRDSVSGALLR